MADNEQQFVFLFDEPEERLPDPELLRKISDGEYVKQSEIVGGLFA